jgi:carbamate kinase
VKKKMICVAMGGNSLIKSKEPKRVENPRRAIRETVHPPRPIVKDTVFSGRGAHIVPQRS